MTRKELIADLIGITVKETEDLLFSVSPLDPDEEIFIARDEQDEENAKQCFDIISVERAEDLELEDGTAATPFTYLLFQDDSLDLLDDEGKDEQILD